MTETDKQSFFDADLATLESANEMTSQRAFISVNDLNIIETEEKLDTLLNDLSF